jgi:uncharacterized membrane protein
MKVLNKTHKTEQFSESTFQTFEDNNRFSTYIEKYGAWFLTVFALIFRLISLDTSFWYDEGFTGHLSRLSSGEIIDFLSKEDVHLPLYFLLARLWAELFSEDVGLRYFSVFLGTLCTPIFFSLCRKLFNTQTAFISTVFLIVSSFHINYSQEVRPYALYMLLATVAIWCVVAALESKQKWSSWWIVYSLSTSLILYTHGAGVLIFVGIAIFHLYLIGIKDRTRLLQWAVFNTFSVIMFLPWTSVMLQQSGRADVYTWLPPVSLKSILSTLQWYIYAPPVEKPGRLIHIVWLAPELILLVTVFFSRDSFIRTKVSALVLLIIVPVAAISAYGYFMGNVFVNRVLAPVVLPIFILSGLPAVAFQRTRWRRPLEVITVLALLFSFIGSLVNLRERRYSDWRGAAAHIKQQIQPGDTIIVIPEKAKYVFGYYFRTNDENYRIISVNAAEELQAFAPEIIKDGQRVWIVRDRVVGERDSESALLWFNQNCKPLADYDFYQLDVLLMESEININK